MDAPEASTDRCAGCGLAVAGGAAGCQAIMDELLALHFGSALWFGSHRLFVDTYCLQHPDRYCASFKSFAAHIMQMCWSLEQGGVRAIPSEAIRRWVERHPDGEKPILPPSRGAVTIGDVAVSRSPAEHHQLVERWARSTWEAYEALHPTARRWVRQALHEERGIGKDGRPRPARK